METKASSSASSTRSQAQEARCRVAVISLFPSYLSGPLGTSILGRAQEHGVLEVDLIDLRAFGEGEYRRVDDRPYGGGPGMVLMPGPLSKAIAQARTPTSHVVCVSPQGKRLDAQVARRLASTRDLVIVCGHYEGIDERVLDEQVDEEISIGDYVLTNGCLPALVLIDAVARFIPGVLSEGSAESESFQDGILEGPHYTRPQTYGGANVPPVLRSGDHRAIAQWRNAQGVTRTAVRRPDLLAEYLTEGRERTACSCGVSLWVRDLATSMRFYTRVLGWKAGRVGENKAILQAPGLGVVLVEGAAQEGARAHVWVEANIEDQVARSGWSHRVREDRRIEICDPDGHLWSVGSKKE